MNGEHSTADNDAAAIAAAAAASLLLLLLMQDDAATWRGCWRDSITSLNMQVSARVTRPRSLDGYQRLLDAVHISTNLNAN